MNCVDLSYAYDIIFSESTFPSAVHNTNGGVDHLTTNYEQTYWWVTSFTPRIQSADVNDIDVHLKVEFAAIGYGDLMTPFFNEWNPKIILGYGDGLSWADVNDAPYEFYIDY